MADSEERWADGFTGHIQCSSGEHARGLIRGKHEVWFDEPSYVDVGTDEHPCPHDYLIAAIGGCQVEVLKQCFETARIDDYEIDLEVESEKSAGDATEEVSDTTNVRITDVRTHIEVSVPPEFEDRSRRCLEIFEENCPISRSVEAGIDLTTRVE